MSTAFLVMAISGVSIARELVVLLEEQGLHSSAPVWLLGYSVAMLMATLSSFKELRRYIPPMMFATMRRVLRGVGFLLLVYAARHLLFRGAAEPMSGGRMAAALGATLVLELWRVPMELGLAVRVLFVPALLTFGIYMGIRWSWTLFWHSKDYSWLVYLGLRVPASVLLASVSLFFGVPQLILRTETRVRDRRTHTTKRRF